MVSTNKQRYQPIYLAQDFSDEAMIRDWTLSHADLLELNNYRKNFRAYIALQICAIRLFGRFINNCSNISIKIINYLNTQLNLAPSLIINYPDREATISEQKKNILEYLGYSKYDQLTEFNLSNWLQIGAKQGKLPSELFNNAEQYLLTSRVILPGASILERLIAKICSDSHQSLFDQLYDILPEELKLKLNEMLDTTKESRVSKFQMLKEFPPSASIASMQDYLSRYKLIAEIDLNSSPINFEQQFITYFYKLAYRYDAAYLKRFASSKRLSLLVCFFLETKKLLLDYLVKMHDQFMQELLRESKNILEKKHKDLRKKQKAAIDTILEITQVILNAPEDKVFNKNEIINFTGKNKLLGTVEDLKAFKTLEEKGLGNILLNRYPSLRKYFPEFIKLPFEAKHGSEFLVDAIQIIRKLDSGELKKLPERVAINFVPADLANSLKDESGKIQRNAWELGLSIAMKDALRSGDLYLSQSKHYVSFWSLVMNDTTWTNVKDTAFQELSKPQTNQVKSALNNDFNQVLELAKNNFTNDDFAEIKNGRLKLRRDDKADVPEKVKQVQKLIDSRMPSIRIEQLLCNNVVYD
ncbi:MAG: DUF4158 domain-containing protein, partial [Neisseriaceae bacterium]